MLEITVKYFLNAQGSDYFITWFDELYRFSAQQDGFINLTYRYESHVPIVTLHFENQEKLNKWVQTEIHNELVAKINAFFIKPREVERKEVAC